MKKIFVPLVLIAAVSLVFTGCAGEEDDIFSASAAERLNESSAKYSARLEAQPNGWAMQYYPTYQDESPYGSGYLILMRFNPDFSVDVSMDNRFSNNAYASATSAWEVIKDNGPVLSFNSYNQCMHAFSDPEDIPWTEDNEQSEGCGGDYEFIIVDAPEDASYMMLKGKKRNTYNLLTPIEVGVDYQEYLADVKDFHKKMFSESAPVGNLIFFGPDSIYHMEDAIDGLPNIYPFGSDAIANESFNPFLITKRGQDYYLRFRDAFERDFIEGTLQELRYDSIQDQFIGTDNPEFIIKGYNADMFLYQNLMNRHVWKFDSNSELTGVLASTLETVSADFLDKKYTIQNVKLTRSGDDCAVVISLKSGKSTVDITYLYDMDVSSGIMQLNYREPYETKNNKRSSQILTTIPSLITFLEALNSSYTATTATETAFNLSKVRVTLSNGSTVVMQYLTK